MVGRNLNTNFNVAPYFDDYNEAKKFLRILFRPSYPVQARELTQLQTILNDQIGRFGESIYEDGSLVTGLNFSLTDNTYLKLDQLVDWNALKQFISAKSFGTGYQINDTVRLSNGTDDAVLVNIGAASTFSFSLINNNVPSGFFGLIATDNINVTSGAEGAQFEVNAKISTTSEPTDGREERPVFLVQGFTTLTSEDPPTLFGEYLTGTEFVAGDEIGIWNPENETITQTLQTLPSDFQGACQLASVQSGIIFTNGLFALVDQQTQPLAKYSTNTSARVGLTVNEDIVTEQTDQTLLDNAAGSPNENAPGAHRFRLTLQLGSRRILDADEEQEADESFYELSRVVDGEIVDRKERPDYSVLGDEMAKRLYDVNGNFVLEPFKITFDDKLLFSLTVDFHTQGSETIEVTASEEDLGISDLTGRIFVVDNIPFEITNTVAGGTNTEFTLTLNDVPDWFTFDTGLLIDVYDSNNFEASFTPGEAYVAGNKFSTIGTTKKDLEKTRTSKHLISEENQFIGTSFGNYLVLDQPDTSTSLTVSDFDTGASVNLYGSDNGTGTSIGTTRVKQLKNTVNNRMELYFFDTQFSTITLTGIDGSGTTLTSSSAFEPGHAGSTFLYDGIRYKIVTYTDPNTVELNTAIPSPGFTGETIELNYNGSAIKSVELANSLAILPVSSSIISDLNGDGYDETKLLETDKTKLIFEISDNIAQSLSDVEYRYMLEDSTTVDGSNVISPSLKENDELLWPSRDQYFIQLTSSNAVVPTEDISSIDNETITLVPGYSGESIIISYPVRRVGNTNPLQTTFVFGNNISATTSMVDGTQYVAPSEGQIYIPSTEITSTNTPQTLGLTGVVKIKEIYELSASSPDNEILDVDDPSFGNTIVTSNYRLDNGQRDDVVDHASIKLKPGAPLPQNDLLVVVDRIQTNSATVGDRTYYSVDSYNQIYYDYLPTVYTSDGDAYDLRSSIDFRPRAQDLGAGDNLLSFTKTFSQLVFPPHAANNSLLEFDVDYYIPRIDKVSISPDLDFKIVQGTPSVDAEAPSTPDRSLVLYDIYQHPYSTEKNDVETTPYNHDRYTMSDISELESRVKTLEKNVQLDKVQKAILSEEVTDESNTNLLKTGVLVDSFSTTDVSDVANEDFRASIDVENGQMRPGFDQYTFSLFLDETDNDTTATKTDDGIILANYDDNAPVSFVNQSFATKTENLNPFAVIDWLGEVKLFPDKDFWKDLIRKPDVVTNMSGSNEAWKFLENNVPDRTEWNNWKTRWTGRRRVSTGFERRLRGRRGILGFAGKVLSRRRRFSTYETRSLQTRSGIRKKFDTQIKKKSLGDQVVDQSVIPYMREVPGGIRFYGKALKPNTRVYPFFDGTSVMDFVRPGIIYIAPRSDNEVVYSNAVVGKSLAEITGYSNLTLTGKSADINNVYFHITPESRSVLYGSASNTDDLAIDSTAISNISKVVDQKIGGEFRLKTDSVGSITGIFEVPSGKFKTGTRTFKLTDSSTDIDGSSNTNAEKDFESSGLRSVVQKNIVSTRTPIIKKMSVRQSRVSTSRKFRVFSNSPTIKRWKDPIAQTFNVDSNEYPSGLYLHSVDLWFTSRDSSLPVTVQIRPVDNGYPDSQTVLPFGETTLDPTEIAVTGTPSQSNYTRFKFSTPVYLEPGDYAIAVMSNSLNYEIYTATLGEKILSTTSGAPTNRVMNKQPYSGVMFKSQNASTWTPVNEQDLMFRVNRADFNVGSYIGKIDVEFDNKQLEALNPFKSPSDVHFTYDSTGTNSQFSYNYYQINVPEVQDFEEVIPPVYSVKQSKVNVNNGNLTPDTLFSETIVNETVETNSVRGVRNLSNNTSFQVEMNFGTNSNIVSPMIDEQQMNVLFVQNLIDELQITPLNDITITAEGSNYAVNDTFIVQDTRSLEELGKLEVTSVDPTTSGVTGLGILSSAEPKYITGTVNIIDDTVSGTGFTAEVQSELDADGGVADARYISKRVNLKSGFESKDLKVVLSAYRPKGTRVYVYYKVKASEDSNSFDNKNWNLMYELSNPNDYSIEESDYIPLEFVTYNQKVDGTVEASTRGGVSYSNGGTVYATFNMYAIKVVMTSESTNKVPILQNLGAMALIDPVMK